MTDGARLDELSPETLKQAREDMNRLATWTMPYGKYQGRRLIDLPEEYLLWFRQKGLPKGDLGRMLRLVLELKVEGLDSLIRRPAAAAQRRE